MRIYGLIGFPLSHSFSPQYFSDKFEKEGIEDAVYNLYPLEELGDISYLFDKGIQGLNVTIPYKESVFQYLDKIDEEAYEIGAVNTIVKRKGKWIGYNTDVYGFMESLQPFLNGHSVNRALVLGSGGSSKAVKYGLNKMGIEYSVVSRTDKGDLTYGELEKSIIADHKLIINTTPLGMSPDVDQCPDIPYEYLTEKHFLYDLVYNPKKTLFLTNGKRQGARTKNGYDMLCLQADKSWFIWSQI